MRGRWARPEKTFAALEAMAIPEPNSGCLLWMGMVNQYGYGRVKIGGQRTVAHRAAYELACGPVPDGLELDHLCRVRCCINPAHLEPVTHRENGRRGVAGQHHADRQAAKTHCPEGHPYSGANLFLRRNGYRECRACMRARNSGAVQ
jgi:hypothetical protein